MKKIRVQQNNNAQKSWWSRNKKKIMIGCGAVALIAIGGYLGYKHWATISEEGIKMIGKVEKTLAKTRRCNSGATPFPKAAGLYSKEAPHEHTPKNFIKALSSIEASAEARSSLPTGFLDNLTGETLPPHRLGDLLGISAQEVNKRLVDAGLQRPYGNGYAVNEVAAQLGKVVQKTTSWGYPFSNIEWDRSVIRLIATPAERVAS